MCRRIFVLQFVPVTPHVIIESIRKTVVELFEERLERTIFCGHFAFIQLEAEKIPAHAELDIGQVAFEHSRREVMALGHLDGQALVVAELSRICKGRICLLVQNRTCFQGIFLTDISATDK